MRLGMDFVTSAIEDESAGFENEIDVPLVIYTKLLYYLEPISSRYLMGVELVWH